MGREVFGYTGKILRIDLTTGAVSTEPAMKYAQKWLGGRGIAQWVLYNELKPWVSPYEPANRIVIGCGPLVGTLAPAACRTSMASKNTFSYGVGTGNLGGHFGPEVKFAGYDHIIIQGRARTPVYLWIDDGHVEIKDARGLWGETTRKTEDLIKEEIGDEDIRKEVGGRLSDDELLLQLILPEENIKGLLSSGPMKTDYPSPALEKPAMVLIRELAQRSSLAYLQMQKEGFSLTLRKSG